MLQLSIVLIVPDPTSHPVPVFLEFCLPNADYGNVANHWSPIGLSYPV